MAKSIEEMLAKRPVDRVAVDAHKKPVKIGVAANQIEKAWYVTNGRTGWFATGFYSDTAEDHCVALCGYGTIAWLAAS